MTGSKFAADLKFFLDYSKWDETLGKNETWADSVHRVMSMHRDNPKLQKAFENPEFKNELFPLVEELYLDKTILGSQRALQFGGAPIMKHNARMFNCLNSHCNRTAFFRETMYWLMNGCGVGFSVQKQHVRLLKPLQKRGSETVVFTIPDSIEGWADAFGVLIESYVRDIDFSEYHGKKIVFDYSLIRPKGAFISGGFKAPGSEGLRKSLEKCEQLLESHITRVGGHEFTEITPIIAYDFVMYMADAVLSGGVRRSATICLFSLDDEEMMKAKTENWFSENPQRARSNNSVVLNRKKITKEQFLNIYEEIKQFGEPGFYFVDDEDQGTNPCVEIGMWPYTDKMEPGWQGCNLTTMAGAKLTTKEKFLRACKASAVLGTIQASYTDFSYVSETTKQIFDREALLGCSITGWMNNPDILLNPEIMREGAELIKETNKKVAAMIGINPAARTTCVKPEGNSSVVLESASGCHGEHSEQFFRVIQINKQSEVAKYLESEAPYLLEESVWSTSNTDYAVFIPTIPSKKSYFKKDLVGVKQLEIVKMIQQNWIEAGRDVELCVRPFLTHNVSNTVEVTDWEEVAEFVWENRDYYSGVSFLPRKGDKIYNQAPFTSILSGQQILDIYGEGALLASGLVVDGLHVFSDLWEACDLVNGVPLAIDGTRQQVLLKEDWLRRAKQFARRYFKGDVERMTFCLKDVHLLHKWHSINRHFANKTLDISLVDLKPKYTEVDTLAAAACSGPNGCELPEGFGKK